METKRTVPGNTVTRKMVDIDTPTGNIYESVAIISKRANQISAELKHELAQKLNEFSTTSDSLEETFENREQIEISRYYERMPKATLIATEEFLGGELYFREGGAPAAAPVAPVVGGVAPESAAAVSEAPTTPATGQETTADSAAPAA